MTTKVREVLGLLASTWSKMTLEEIKEYLDKEVPSKDNDRLALMIYALFHVEEVV